MDKCNIVFNLSSQGSMASQLSIEKFRRLHQQKKQIELDKKNNLKLISEENTKKENCDADGRFEVLMYITLIIF